MNHYKYTKYMPACLGQLSFELLVLGAQHMHFVSQTLSLAESSFAKHYAHQTIKTSACQCSQCMSVALSQRLLPWKVLSWDAHSRSAACSTLKFQRDPQLPENHNSSHAPWKAHFLAARSQTATHLPANFAIHNWQPLPQTCRLKGLVFTVEYLFWLELP